MTFLTTLSCKLFTPSCEGSQSLSRKDNLLKLIHACAARLLLGSLVGNFRVVSIDLKSAVYQNRDWLSKRCIQTRISSPSLLHRFLWLRELCDPRLSSPCPVVLRSTTLDRCLWEEDKSYTCALGKGLRSAYDRSGRVKAARSTKRVWHFSLRALWPENKGSFLVRLHP